jgi:Fe-S oxidoreductase
MTVIFLGTLGMFAWSAQRRLRLLLVGAPDPEMVSLEKALDGATLQRRIENVLVYALGQKKMANNERYSLAGVAHIAIFAAFQILLLNTILLWGRAYDTSFDFFGLLSEENIVGQLYSLAKELIVAACIAGCGVFFYLRVINPQKRMTLSGEGLLILFIISTMMMADYLYVGARFALDPANAHEGIEWFSPIGSLLGGLLRGSSHGTLLALEHVGFWWHATWVLLFLNMLPYSKHFHIITSLPNVFGQKLDPLGKLPDVEDIEGKIEREEPIGVAKIEHLDQKQILDLYTCTECGRCSDNCPAFTTGKKLSPKHLTLALRDHLYDLEEHFLGHGGIDAGAKDAHATVHGDPPEGAYFRKAEDVQLVPDIVSPEVIWACTTCRACEEQCPVNISYVDKIVSMRRAEMMVKNEFPKDLQKAFKGMEVNGSPWNLPASDRGNWATGLEVPFLADHPDAEVVYWVGCAAEFDPNAQSVARSVAKLLNHAGVKWAAMGSEATCTGDPARRAGNEYLFQTLAQANVETLNGAGADKKTILTACPHCFNTLKNEYPSFGGKYDVVHHSEYLNGLVARGLLKPTKSVSAKVAYHDSCYLGRYNDVYEAPRQILRAIPGVQLVEVPYWNKQKGLCCGAGGAQMWKEEEHSHGPSATRVNKKRTLQILETGAEKVATGCPFCMTMISDGINAEDKKDDVENLDLAQLLDRSIDYSAEAEDEAAE